MTDRNVDRAIADAAIAWAFGNRAQREEAACHLDLLRRRYGVSEKSRERLRLAANIIRGGEAWQRQLVLLDVFICLWVAFWIAVLYCWVFLMWQ